MIQRTVKAQQLGAQALKKRQLVTGQWQRVQADAPRGLTGFLAGRPGCVG